MHMIWQTSHQSCLTTMTPILALHPDHAEAPALDCHDLAHLVIDGLFGLVFPDPHARRRLGLLAVSRVRQTAMAWYIRTAARRGAFEMALLPGSLESDVNGGGALFALRYFPAPQEGVYTRFAPIEQQARRSPLFDPTGTPGLDSAEKLDASLFHVGTLVIVPQGAAHIGVRLIAQDRWVEQEWRGDDWSMRRDVPGLRLSLGILDPLICALSYLGRRPPMPVRVWRRPGLAWRIEANGGAYSQPEPDASEWEIALDGLVVPGRAGTVDVDLPELPSHTTEHPLFEYAAEIPPHYAPWPVSAQWWQAAGWQFDPVGAFCSCCSEHVADTHESHEHVLRTKHHLTRSDDDELDP